MSRILRTLGRITVRLSLLVVLLWAGWLFLHDGESPLPDAWHPAVPLDVEDPETWVTDLKLRRALVSDEACLAALGTGARFASLPALEDGACGIDPRVSLSRLGEVALAPVETTCAVALRAAMWERHALRGAAIALGSPIVGLRHQGSYNCRPVRGGRRPSSHATAGALDVRGVELGDGRRLDIAAGWGVAGAEGAFWRAARNGACAWFGTVLGPEYNALHADHFHLQSSGRGLCR